jgi:type V secretory pathway adhesin AidA
MSLSATPHSSTIRADARAAEDCNGEAVASWLDVRDGVLVVRTADAAEGALVKRMLVYSAAITSAVSLAEARECAERQLQLGQRYWVEDTRDDAAREGSIAANDTGLAWLRRAAGCLERLRAAFCGRRREVA